MTHAMISSTNVGAQLEVTLARKCACLYTIVCISHGALAWLPQCDLSHCLCESEDLATPYPWARRGEDARGGDADTAGGDRAAAIAAPASDATPAAIASDSVAPVRIDSTAKRDRAAAAPVGGGGRSHATKSCSANAGDASAALRRERRAAVAAVAAGVSAPSDAVRARKATRGMRTSE